MDLITHLIFGFLCGMLYLVGWVFGFTYEEISVYICIYGWPVLCVAMPTVIALVALYNWIKKLTLWNTINLALSVGATIVFSIYAKLFYQLANELGMTYEQINLWVYCYLFLAIALVMWLWFEITIPRKWIINRLWYDHLPLFSFPK